MDNNLDKAYNEKGEISQHNQILFKVINISYLQDNNSLVTVYVMFKDKKYQIQFMLTEFEQFIESLSHLNYTFLPGKKINRNKVKEDIQSKLNFLSTRFDILSCELSKIFFKLNNFDSLSSFKELVTENNIKLLYKFKEKEGDSSLDFTSSDMKYDTNTGLLMLSYEDNTILSSIGKFWSLIDSDIAGSISIYQRLFDTNNKPYFTKKLTKCFDVKASKIDINSYIDVIFVGFENGTVHSFIIRRNDSVINIIEGIQFKYFTTRITSFSFYNNFTFIAGAENKILVVQLTDETKRNVEVIVNASVKKRMEGKGIIKELIIQKDSNKLYIISSTNLILVYDIIIQNENSLIIKYAFSFLAENTIKSIYIKASCLFISTINKIQFVNTLQRDTNNNFIQDVIPLDGSNTKSTNNSLSFININNGISIQSIVFFPQMKIIILGLSTGTIMSINIETFEVVYSRKISENSINNIILLEENYVIIVGDSKGITYFFELGAL